MKTENIHGKIAFVAALFVTSVFVLGIKLLNPTPIQIFVNGNNVVTKQIPGFFTYTDVVILVIASLVLGISGAYLLFSVPVPAEKPATAEDAGRVILEERKKRWDELSKTLKDDERKIYETILESDGIIEQSEIVEKTGLPKANVSRSLDLLESKGLAERRRRGTGNVVLLK
ncbi:MAG: helix-turn-helix domain-containing protein [Euryarchaeota archaeon]|nr:helix-turn-helix domain-containing protein [Euryarchaeota archaeon]